MGLAANRGQPPGEAAQTPVGAIKHLFFQFSNGKAAVLLGATAGDGYLGIPLRPLAYSLTSRGALGAALITTMSVDVQIRTFGTAFASICGTEKPTLSAESESGLVPVTTWPDFVIGTHPIGIVDSLTGAPPLMSMLTIVVEAI